MLWSVAEIPLLFFLRPTDGWAGLSIMLLQSVISLVIGYLVVSIVLGSFSSVALAKEENSAPTA